MKIKIPPINVVDRRIFVGVLRIREESEHSMYCKALLQPINSETLVRQRTIPTERPPLVGEVSANFSG
jgi:hypothetical protein